MHIFLTCSAIALFIFGIILLLKPDLIKKFSDFLNKSILPLEDRMRASNMIGGAVLIILSVIIFYLAAKK